MLFGRKERAINRILIVEDEALVAFDNERFLADAGYEIVATVDSLETALVQIEEEKIDLVLADVRLSGDGDGLDVARAAHGAKIPVLFVSASCPIEARAVAIGHLAKPYASRDLRTAIEAVDATLRGEEPKKTPAALSLYLPDAL